MSGFENHAGITVTNSKLQLVEIIKKNDQFVLENIDEAYYSEMLNFSSDKETKISTIIQNALNELLIKKTLTSGSVSFSLPFDLFQLMQVPFEDNLLHQDLIEEFRKELSILYPFVPSKDLVIQYFQIDKNNYIEMNTAFVLAIQRKYLNLLNNLCSYNNLKLKFIDNIHISSEKSLSVIKAYSGKNLTLSIYLNSKNLSIIYSLKGKLIFYKLIPLNDVREITEHLKREINSSNDEGNSNNIGANLNRQSIESTYICGEDLTPSIVDSLSDEVGLSFIQFNPFDKITPNEKLFENFYYLDKYNSFSPSAGISFRLA